MPPLPRCAREGPPALGRVAPTERPPARRRPRRLRCPRRRRRRRLAVRGGDSARRTTTAFAGKSPAVTAEMVREGDTGMLRLSNVHQLPPDKVLQAWVQRGKTVESADVLFAPNSKGSRPTVIADMNGVDIVMVTTEPRGGSTTPTSKPLVTLQLSSS